MTNDHKGFSPMLIRLRKLKLQVGRVMSKGDIVKDGESALAEKQR